MLYEVITPAARVDLQTAAGVALVHGAWRYSDVEIVPTTHRAPDASGQPTGLTVDTWTLRPLAGAKDFDDSSWPVIDPGVDYTHPDLAPNMWSAPTAFTVDVGGVFVSYNFV